MSGDWSLRAFATPVSEEEIRSRVSLLTPYGVDIWLWDTEFNRDKVPLWTSRRVYDQEELDLMWRCLNTPTAEELEALVRPN